MQGENRRRRVTSRLKALENEGLIIRKVYSEIPPKVEYALSDIGEKFKKVLVELEVWGNEYIEYMNTKINKRNDDE